MHNSPLGRLRLAIDRFASARRAGASWARLDRAPAPSSRDIDDARQRLVRLLDDDLVPAWFPAAIDPGGGYRSPDATGNEPETDLVGQSQVLWFAACLARRGHRDATDWARQGYQYLDDRLRDSQHGGHHWRVTRSGEPIETRKHLYGSLMALEAIAEYALATDDAGARARAVELFELVERHAAADRGYREYFERDWTPVPGEERSYMQERADVRQLNTHLRVLEAYTALWHLTHDPVVAQRLADAVDLLSTAPLRADQCRNVHDPAWRPPTSADDESVIYGHDLELAWLMLDACRSIGRAPPIDLATRLARACWHHGWDHLHGGFCFSGPPGAAADQRRKVWWVQADALVCLLILYQRTRQPCWFAGFLATLDWIERRQLDRVRGEWHLRISPDGHSGGERTRLIGIDASWKTPFHAGRALLRGLETLDALR